MAFPKGQPDRRFCEYCPEHTKKIATARVPGLPEWACEEHAIAFWRGAATTAGALRELDRQTLASCEADFEQTVRDRNTDEPLDLSDGMLWMLGIERLSPA